MYTNTIHTMVIGQAEEGFLDVEQAYECFKSVMPFIIDVLIRSFNCYQSDDQEPFTFENGIDFAECLQTIEIIMAMGESGAQKQFFEH